MRSRIPLKLNQLRTYDKKNSNDNDYYNDTETDNKVNDLFTAFLFQQGLIYVYICKETSETANKGLIIYKCTTVPLKS